MIPACKAYGVGLIPWSPLKGGVLGGLEKKSEGRRTGDLQQKTISKNKDKLERFESFCKARGEHPADVALACRANGVPFYVAAPLSTFDPSTARGEDVVIEDRPGDAALYLKAGVARADLPTREPAFDVTPAELVTGYLTPLGASPRPPAVP